MEDFEGEVTESDLGFKNTIEAAVWRLDLGPSQAEARRFMRRIFALVPATNDGDTIG